MFTPLAWTGERLVPHIEGDITFEHLHRYALAMDCARDAVVLDIACGEGYGSNLLAQVAREVIGVDVSPEASNAPLPRREVSFEEVDVCRHITKLDSFAPHFVHSRTLEWRSTFNLLDCNSTLSYETS